MESYGETIVPEDKLKQLLDGDGFPKDPGGLGKTPVYRSLSDEERTEFLLKYIGLVERPELLGKLERGEITDEDKKKFEKKYDKPFPTEENVEACGMTKDLMPNLNQEERRKYETLDKNLVKLELEQHYYNLLKPTIFKLEEINTKGFGYSHNTGENER